MYSRDVDPSPRTQVTEQPVQNQDIPPDVPSLAVVQKRGARSGENSRFRYCSTCRRYSGGYPDTVIDERKSMEILFGTDTVNGQKVTLESK